MVTSPVRGAFHFADPSWMRLAELCVSVRTLYREELIGIGQRMRDMLDVLGERNYPLYFRDGDGLVLRQNLIDNLAFVNASGIPFEDFVSGRAFSGNINFALGIHYLEQYERTPGVQSRKSA